MRMRTLLVTVPLLHALGCSASTGGAPVPAGATGAGLPAVPADIPLRPYFRELRTVDVVSGRDTLVFLLDTGGGHTLVTPEVAVRLGCEPYGRSVGHRMSGERVEFQWCGFLPLVLEGIALHDATVAVFDLGAVLPRELPALDGVLALPSLRGHVVTLDLAGARVPAARAGRAGSAAAAGARAAASRRWGGRVRRGAGAGPDPRRRPGCVVPRHARGHAGPAGPRAVGGGGADPPVRQRSLSAAA
jgi:hypothetical protein